MANKFFKLYKNRRSSVKGRLLDKYKSRSIKKETRQKQIKLRKNFLPTLLLIVILWSAVFYIVYFVNPYKAGVIILFLLLIFLSLLFTFATLFANTRRGLITAIALTLFLLLRYLGIGNALNLLLILGLSVAVEIYSRKG